MVTSFNGMDVSVPQIKPNNGNYANKSSLFRYKMIREFWILFWLLVPALALPSPVEQVPFPEKKRWKTSKMKEKGEEIHKHAWGRGQINLLWFSMIRSARQWSLYPPCTVRPAKLCLSLIGENTFFQVCSIMGAPFLFDVLDTKLCNVG